MLTRIRFLLNKLVKRKDGVTYRSTKFLRASKNTAEHRIQKIYNPIGKQVHGGYVMGAWLFRQDIDHVKLEKCIEQSLLYYPWYASRVTEVVNESYTLKNDNQGIIL